MKEWNNSMQYIFNKGAEFSSSPYNTLQKKTEFLKNNQPPKTAEVIHGITNTNTNIFIQH